MLEAKRVRCDESSRKINNISVKEFHKGQRVRCYDIKGKRYSLLGTIYHILPPSGDGLIRNFRVKLDYNIVQRVIAAWIRPNIDEPKKSNTYFALKWKAWTAGNKSNNLDCSTFILKV